MTQLVVEEILKSVRDLPPLPQSVERVLQLTDDPQSTVGEVAAAVAMDQALVADILKLANSAYYGFSRRIGTIQEAIVLLGFATVRSLIFASSVKGLLGRKMEGYFLEAGELWRHSLGCAVAARIVAKRARYRGIENAFVAGLLHDIGKVVLSFYVHSQFAEIVGLTKASDISFIQAEKQVLGIDHCEVGSAIAQHWNLPDDLASAIRDHHQPSRAGEARDLASIVHLADALCLMMGVGIGGDGLLYPLCLDVLGQLDLDVRDIESLLSEVTTAVADIEKD